MVKHDQKRDVEVMIVADEWPQMRELGRRLTSLDSIVIHGTEEGSVAADLSPYDALIMYVHGVLGASLEQALIRYTLQGGRLVILHHGLASAKIQNPAWMAFTGMHIEPSDAAENAWKVLGHVTHSLVNLNPSHYITSHRMVYPDIVQYQTSDSLTRPGPLPAIALKDTELFMNQQFTDAREKTVLLGSHCVHPESGVTVMQDRGAWCKPAGKGWICYLQTGHSEPDFQVPSIAQLIANCITWNP